jgi:hypothetical protein
MQAYSPQVAPRFGERTVASSGLTSFFVLWAIVVLGIVIAIFVSMQRHLVSDQPAQTSSLASYMETAAPEAHAWLLTHPGRGGTMQCQFAGANPMDAVKANYADASGDPYCR